MSADLHAGADDAGDTTSVAHIPTSFGVFKPVGWVMMGLPTSAQGEALITALHGAGFASGSVLKFTPRETPAELQAMAEHAGSAAGFGYEITLLRRYVALAQQGYQCCWSRPMVSSMPLLPPRSPAVAVRRWPSTTGR